MRPRKSHRNAGHSNGLSPFSFMQVADLTVTANGEK
jgi:hypothetical protein